MIHPSHNPNLDQETLEKMLRGMIRARIATLPEPLKKSAGSLRGATSTPMLEEMIDDLSALGVDWSRAGPTFSGWGADYCDCIFCGSSVANKRGIEKHMQDLECRVLEAMVNMARSDYCKTSYWQDEIADEQRARDARAQNLCVVDLHRGQQELHSVIHSRKNLDAIEPRLESLGFQKIVKQLPGGRTETRWELVTDDAYVLADPREAGRIYIRAWPLGEKAGTKRRRAYRAAEYILDDWHRDLPKKLADRIAKQLGKT